MLSIYSFWKHPLFLNTLLLSQKVLISLFLWCASLSPPSPAVWVRSTSPLLAHIFCGWWGCFSFMRAFAVPYNLLIPLLVRRHLSLHAHSWAVGPYLFYYALSVPQLNTCWSHYSISCRWCSVWHRWKLWWWQGDFGQCHTDLDDCFHPKVFY